MEKKITKAQMFAQIRDAIEIDIANNHEDSDFNADMIAFINHEIELLSKKSDSKKPTATQVANEGLKATILTVLDGSDGMTASEVLAASADFDGMSNQKISALLRQLVLDNVVVKDTSTKRTLFKLA